MIARVIGAQFVALFRAFGDARVGRPVEDRSAIAASDSGLRNSAGAWKGSCGSKVSRCSSHSSAPLVGVEEIHAGVETAHRRKIRILADEFPIDQVARQLVPALRAELLRVVHLAQTFPRRLHHRLPRIAFLPADEVVCVVAVVVSRAAVAPVVEMVGDQVGINAMLMQHARQRMVEGLQRPPAAMQEIQSAGVHVAPRRHARQAADVVIVESHARAARREKFGVLIVVPP